MDFTKIEGILDIATNFKDLDDSADKETQMTEQKNNTKDKE